LIASWLGVGWFESNFFIAKTANQAAGTSNNQTTKQPKNHSTRKTKYER